MTTPEQLEINSFYVKDGTQRHVVKLLSIGETTVTFNWMGIILTKDREEFCKHFTYISVPVMGDAQ